jgi:predicted porin
MAASGSAVAKAKKPKLTVGGYQAAGFDLVNNGDAGGANTGGLHQVNDGEIHFKLSGQLANGVKISGKVELEAGSAEGADQVDEDWIKFSSPSMGQIILGSTDSASMRLVTGAQWGTSLYNIPFERGELVPAPSSFYGSGPGFSTRATLGDSDDPKIIWISPVIGGLQFGLSYMRDGAKGPDDVKAQVAFSGDAENHWTTGVKYSGKFGKAKVVAAIGYLRNTIPAIGDEISAVVAGMTYETGPLKFSWGIHSQDDPTVGAGSKDGTSYEAGLKYTAGANKFSIAGFHGAVKNDTTVAGDDESDTIMLAHTNAVGPGVTWRNALSCTDWDGEGTGVTEDQTGCGIHTGVKISF